MRQESDQYRLAYHMPQAQHELQNKRMVQNDDLQYLMQNQAQNAILTQGNQKMYQEPSVIEMAHS